MFETTIRTISTKNKIRTPTLIHTLVGANICNPTLATSSVYHPEGQNEKQSWKQKKQSDVQHSCSMSHTIWCKYRYTHMYGMYVYKYACRNVYIHTNIEPVWEKCFFILFHVQRTETEGILKPPPTRHVRKEWLGRLLLLLLLLLIPPLLLLLLTHETPCSFLPSLTLEICILNKHENYISLFAKASLAIAWLRR